MLVRSRPGDCAGSSSIGRHAGRAERSPERVEPQTAAVRGAQASASCTHSSRQVSRGNLNVISGAGRADRFIGQRVCCCFPDECVAEMWHSVGETAVWELGRYGAILIPERLKNGTAL